MLVRLAREWREYGRDTWSIDAAFQVARWQRRIAGLPSEEEKYKLNNNHRAHYARLIMEQEEDLDGIFELRALTA